MADLNYQIRGDGMPLLMLHGFGITYNIWQNLAPILERHFRLIMVELPGVGNSTMPEIDRPYYLTCADALDQLRRELGIAQWSVLCYSSGTRVAEVYMRRYRQTIYRGVFLCPLYIPGWRWYSLRLATWADTMLPQFGQWALSGWRLGGLVTILGFNGARSSYTVSWIQEISHQPITTLRRTLRELPDPGYHMLTLDVPTLFIWGYQDRIAARPTRHNAYHKYIRTTHGAPLLAAYEVAEMTIKFLRDKSSSERSYPLATFTQDKQSYAQDPYFNE